MWNDLDAFIEQSRHQWRVPGVAVAVVKDDAILLAKGYSTRAIGEQAPVTVDTIFAFHPAHVAHATKRKGLRIAWR